MTPTINVSDELEKATALLESCIVRGGFAAALESRDNYRNIWSRDGCINGLAGLTLGNKSLISAFKDNLRTLAKHQGNNGEIPSNVNLVENTISYGSKVGRVDASIWFIVGMCVYGRLGADDSFVLEHWEHLDRIVALLNAWEFNLGGLLYIPYSGDWADEYILSGYLLYDQVLRLWAMRELAMAAKRLGKNDKKALIKVQQIEALINQRFLPDSNRPYFLAGYNPGEKFEMFDAFGNALCCLLELGTDQNRSSTLAYAAECSKYDMVPAFYPIIEHHDPQYAGLLRAALAAGKSEPRNKPGCYHNGGLWPFLNGFWVLAAKKYNNQHQASCWTHGIMEANSLQSHGFFEFRDSKTGAPGGTKGQAWSGAGLILSQADPSLLFVESTKNPVDKWQQAD